MGPGSLQADFEHAVGHRHDLVDRAERVLQRIVAARRDLPLEQPRDLLRGELPAVRPLDGLQPEDVAEAVVGDVPALRKARHDLARRIEPDQPLADVGQKNGLRLGQRSRGGIGDLGRLADDEHVRLALVCLLAAGGDERCQDQRLPQHRRGGVTGDRIAAV